MGIEIEGDKIELHTLGWSGNEDIIRELQKSSLWLMHWSKTFAGGHYYFNLGRYEEEYAHDDEAYNNAINWYELGLRAAKEGKVEEYQPRKVNFKVNKS
jgi:hypothetical protein